MKGGLDYWVLDGHEAVPATQEEWAAMFGRSDRIVRVDEYGDVTISTVFLGIDHSFGFGPPLLFETMVFGDAENEDRQWRYSTWEQAEAGHRALLALVLGIV